MAGIDIEIKTKYVTGVQASRSKGRVGESSSTYLPDSGFRSWTVICYNKLFT